MENCTVYDGLDWSSARAGVHCELSAGEGSVVDFSRAFDMQKLEKSAEFGCEHCPIIYGGVDCMINEGFAIKRSKMRRGRLILRFGHPLEVQLSDDAAAGATEVSAIRLEFFATSGASQMPRIHLRLGYKN
jgi:hypothetical protein